jgi:hypothetical protein
LVGDRSGVARRGGAGPVGRAATRAGTGACRHRPDARPGVRVLPEHGRAAAGLASRGSSASAAPASHRFLALVAPGSSTACYSHRLARCTSRERDVLGRFRSPLAARRVRPGDGPPMPRLRWWPLLGCLARRPCRLLTRREDGSP